MPRFSLTGNQLKLIALISMTLDHIGAYLRPDVTVFRILGRIAFPIFAYFIAEGCRYTRSCRKYLCSVLGLGLLMQTAAWCFRRTLHQNILITFGLSILLILALEQARSGRKAPAVLISALILAAVFVFPQVLKPCGFSIDYSLPGILLPVALYFTSEPRQKPLITAVFILALSLLYGPLELWALAAIPLLACYNGKRGMHSLKYLFYVYYPAHLALIHLAEYYGL